MKKTVEMKSTKRNSHYHWHSLREDRTMATSRIVEHLILGGTPEDVVEILANAQIDMPHNKAVRYARDYWEIISNVRKDMFGDEDWELVDTLITKLRSEGNENREEILRSIKIELRVLGHDTILRERIELQISKFHLPETWKKEWTSAIGRRSVFSIERQDNDRLVARVSRDTRLDARVAWYSPSKGYGVGVVDGIVEEGAVHNRVRILPTAVMAEQGVVASGFGSVSLKVRGCPVIPLSEGAYDRLYAALVPPVSSLALGVCATNGRPLFRGTRAILQEQSVGQIVSDLESRMPMVGLPGSAKTTLANQILRQIAVHSNLPIVAVSPAAPNLAGFGGIPQVINNAGWNIQGVGESYISQTYNRCLPGYEFMTLSERTVMPSLDHLHTQTVMEVLVAVSRSPQIRAIWASRFAHFSPAEVLDRAAAGHLFDQNDGFEPQQARTAQRYATILRSMFNTSGHTVDLGKLLVRETTHRRYLGIFIPTESSFVSELTFIVLAEIFNRARNTYDPQHDGIVVALDEIPYLYETIGAVIPGSECVNLFGRMSLQGRNRGLLLMGLMQDERYLSYAFPGKAEDYPKYMCMKQGEARLLSTPRTRVWIPPVSYQPA